MRKLNVAVLFGGKSTEHEISKISAREVVKNLNPKKYNVLPISVSRDGISWQIQDRKKQSLNSPATKSANPVLLNQPSIIKKNKIDLIFIAMHGQFGEDGTVQGFLDLAGIPYTGSRVLASAIGMDKLYSRKIFQNAKLKVPIYVVIRKGDGLIKVWKRLVLPIFVHPNNQGSAIGATLVENKKDLEKAVKKAHKYSNIALVEEYIKGTEVTCAIIGNEKLTALPLVEIRPKREFFDYKAKYNEELCDEIVPAQIDGSLAKKAKDTAIVAYKAIGVQVFGRVDMIIRGKRVYVLEINTIPGLTPVSLFPKAAKAAGISYSQLLDKIIDLSLKK